MSPKVNIFAALLISSLVVIVTLQIVAITINTVAQNKEKEHLMEAIRHFQDLTEQTKFNFQNSVIFLQDEVKILRQSTNNFQHSFKKAKKAFQNSLNALQDEVQILHKSFDPHDYNFCHAGGNRIAYINTNLTDECPPKMRLEINNSTGQKACGVNVNSVRGCPVVLRFTVNQNYSNICGRIRGYQFGAVQAFKYSKTSPRQSYADGFQILQIESPTSFRHIWTYAIGISENETLYGSPEICPRDRSNTTDRSYVPSFVGEHFYCETGNTGSIIPYRLFWNDPLWDGAGCISATSHSCETYGWFHRQLDPSNNDLIIRICPNGYNRNVENVFLDMLEIWIK